jgi:3-hydroxyisobutyrate dehydrogenase-like beta-hydroxyacid dehydrogenase
MDSMQFGWIGLGAIGASMVERALSFGHPLTAYARGQGTGRVAAKGAVLCQDYRQLAEGSDVLTLCLFDDGQVRNVLFDEGALSAMHPGSTLVIHTTGSPELAREIGRKAPTGVGVLDAAFSGGQDAALAGELTIMVGGNAEAVEQVRPLLSTYARLIHHAGALGSGQMTKLLNNLLFATNLRNAAELLKIGEAQGFEPAQLARLIQSCSGASSAMRSFCSDGPLDETLTRLRRFVDKDVATVARSAPDNAIGLGTFRETLEYFAPAAADDTAN